MLRWFLAGAAYFAIVFAAAFALGIVRVSFIVPVLGSLWATLLELPFTLGIAWFACAWISRLSGSPSLSQAITMAASAFVLLIGAETVGSFLIFKRSPADLIASYGTMAGALGLVGQIAFGCFPVLQCIRDNSTRADRTPPRAS